MAFGLKKKEGSSCVRVFVFKIFCDIAEDNLNFTIEKLCIYKEYLLDPLDPGKFVKNQSNLNEVYLLNFE